ncbi:MAG TPA: DUF2085 domain-containing protein [Ktedonobacterales bacterium]|nr:DUF2085 domain-containing protein [Ktedonobacterales bacterium]
MTLESPVERGAPIAPVMPAPAAFNPPDWLLYALTGVYLAALAALVFAPGGTLLDRLRALDAGICAQLPSHSFYPASQQLPLCARNTGIYMGFTATVGVLWLTGRLGAARLPALPVALALGAAVALMGLDGFNSLFLDLRLPHLYQPHNLLRLATGLGTGTAMAAFLIPIANGMLWRSDDARPSFSGFGQLLVMAPILLMVFIGVASQVGWLLYPLALVGTAGLVTALALVNLVMGLAASGYIARCDRVRQIIPAAAIAVAVAIVELVVLSAFKTWALHALGAPA